MIVETLRQTPISVWVILGSDASRRESVDKFGGLAARICCNVVFCAQTCLGTGSDFVAEP